MVTHQPGPPQPPYPPPQRAPRPIAYPAPARVEVVAGTNFGVAIPRGAPIGSGMAIGSLVVGIGSIVVSFAVGCFGVQGAEDGWGPWAAGAFAVLSALLGIAGITLGVLARRQVRRASAVTGSGLAMAGLICGAVGLALTLLSVAGAILLTLSAA